MRESQHLSFYILRCKAKTDSKPKNIDSVKYDPLDPLTVINLVQKCSERVAANETIKARSLTCFAKLTERFASCDSAILSKLRALIKSYESSMSLELQLRSCEYTVLINGNGSASGALARMPIVDSKAIAAKRSTSLTSFSMGAEGVDDDDLLSLGGGGVGEGEGEGGGVGGGGALLDLDDIFGGGDMGALAVGGGSINNTTTTTNNNNSSNNNNNNNVNPTGNVASGAVSPPTTDLDLLSNIFANPSSNSYNSKSNIVPPQAPIPGDIFSSPVTTSTPSTTINAFAKAGMNINFICSKTDANDAQKTDISVSFTNSTDVDMVSLVFQAAVPKYITMEVLPPSSTTIPCNNGGDVKQIIKVKNNMLGTKSLMIKLKLKYESKGETVEEMATITIGQGEY